MLPIKFSYSSCRCPVLKGISRLRGSKVKETFREAPRHNSQEQGTNYYYYYQEITWWVQEMEVMGTGQVFPAKECHVVLYLQHLAETLMRETAVEFTPHSLWLEGQWQLRMLEFLSSL